MKILHLVILVQLRMKSSTLQFSFKVRLELNKASSSQKVLGALRALALPRFD